MGVEGSNPNQLHLCAPAVTEVLNSTLYFLFGWLYESPPTSKSTLASEFHVLLSRFLDFPDFFFFDLSTEARILKAKCLKALKAIESVVWSCQPSKYIQWQQKCLLMEREELVEYSELANSYNNFIY